MAAKDKKNHSPTIINRKAAHDYFFVESHTAGIVLKGTEIKAIRDGKVQMLDAYCAFDNEHELYVRNLQISPYDAGSYNNHDPKRPRKLLMNRRELDRLQSKLGEPGSTLIPTKLYFNERNIAKLEISLAKGKKKYDKRESIKEKEMQRNKQRQQYD